MYFDGRWGTVCNDGWDDKYASLVCTQLKFGPLGELADFGRGAGNILLENVMCTINDKVLASCGHYGVGITVRCDHSRDTGVKCHGMYTHTNNFYSNFICTYFKVLQQLHRLYRVLVRHSVQELNCNDSRVNNSCISILYLQNIWWVYLESYTYAICKYRYACNT